MTSQQPSTVERLQTQGFPSKRTFGRGGTLTSFAAERHGNGSDEPTQRSIPRRTICGVLVEHGPRLMHSALTGRKPRFFATRAGLISWGQHADLPWLGLGRLGHPDLPAVLRYNWRSCLSTGECFEAEHLSAGRRGISLGLDAQRPPCATRRAHIGWYEPAAMSKIANALVALRRSERLISPRDSR